MLLMFTIIPLLGYSQTKGNMTWCWIEKFRLLV